MYRELERHLEDNVRKNNSLDANELFKLPSEELFLVICREDKMWQFLSRHHIMANTSTQNYGIFTDLLVKRDAEIEGNLLVDGDLTLGPTSTLVVPGSVDIGTNLFVGGSEAIVGNLAVGGSELIENNLTVNGSTLVNTLTATGPIVGLDGLGIQGNITATGSVAASALCLNDQAAPPASSVSKGCFYTIAGTPDSLQFIDNSGTTYTVDLTPNNPFHGYWQRISRPNMYSFDQNYDENTYDTDPYIFINVTTKPYVTIEPAFFGTLKYPRQPTLLDETPPFDRNYWFASPTQLVGTFDLQGPTPGAIPSTFCLNLQPDGKTLFACGDSQFNYNSTTLYALYRKIDSIPVPVMGNDETSTSAVTDPNDPVFLAKYLISAWQTQYFDQSNVNLHDLDFVGIPQAEALFKQFLTTGFTQTTPIRQMRVSINPAPTPELATDIFTGDYLTGIGQFSYATPGATVTLAGFVDQGLIQWSKFNGTYINGVAYLESGAVPNPRATHVDAGSNGTFYNVFDHFLLRGVNQQTGFNCDSSSFPTKPQQGPPNIVPAGYANYPFDGTQTVAVSHRITSDMEYPAFIAAIYAMFYAVYRVSQHHGLGVWTVPHSIHIYDTWSQLAANLKTGGIAVKVNMVSRDDQASPTNFYNNVNLSLNNRATIPTYNDPYGISTHLSTYNYSIVLGNYVIDTQSLFFGVQGTLQPDQTDPAVFGYPSLIPGPGRAGFIGLLVPSTVTNGLATVVPPDPTYYLTVGGTGAGLGTPNANANSYFISIVNPSLLPVGSKKIGLVRWGNMGWVPKHSLGLVGIYSPESNTSPRFARGGMSSLYAPIMKYFATDQNVDSLILDLRGNEGGNPVQPQTLREFMGSDQNGMTEVFVKNDVGYSALVNPTTFTGSYNNVQDMNKNSNGRVYVSLNQAMYPQSVFQGTAIRPRKVVILHNWASESAGDFVLGQFLGENLDGNLGAFVTVHVIGDTDGRLKGAAAGFNPLPISDTAPRLVNNHGVPVSPVTYRADGLFPDNLMGNPLLPSNVQGLYSAPQAAPSWVGKSGGNPLPNDWENTVWNSIGFITPPALPPLPGWSAPPPNPAVPTTWRDFGLEQAILLANS